MSDDEERDRAFARGDNEARAELRASGQLPAATAFIDGKLGVFYGEGSCACSECPFAEAELDPYPPNYWDKDEGHYYCHLLKREHVWGESPKCTDEDWRTKARAELEELKMEAVVESLLAAGWKPPTTIQCNRCEHFIHEHNAGGCNACSCSLPHGGR